MGIKLIKVNIYVEIYPTNLLRLSLSEVLVRKIKVLK